MLSLRLFIWKTFTSAFCSDAYITIQTSGKIISTVPHRIPLPHVSCHISVYKITMQYHYYRCAKTVNSPVHFSSICNRTQITLGLIVLNSENSHLLESKPQNLDWYSRFSTGMWLTGRHTEHTTSVATGKCTPYMWCSLDYADLVFPMLQRWKSRKVHIKFRSRTQAFMLMLYGNDKTILRYFCDPVSKADNILSSN